MQAFDVKSVLEGYDKDDLTIVTVCSHSSLQIFHGAKKEGFRTLGITVGRPPKLYNAFPLAKPDEFLTLDRYDQVIDHSDEILERNGIVIPHGSFVEYMGADNFRELPVPTFGNRKVLEWESDRNMERKWLESAGVNMPREIKDPRNIDRPVMVKYQGAKGGRGFFIAKDYNQFKMGIDHTQKFNIQEYILGTRYYLHFFHSPLREEGYQVEGAPGIIELLSMDRRDETNIDEMYKLGSQEELKEHGIYPTFVDREPSACDKGIPPLEGLRDGREHREEVLRALRRDDRPLLSRDRGDGPAEVRGVRDLRQDRRRDEPVHHRIPLFGFHRTGSLHREAYSPGDKACSPHGKAGRDSDLRGPRSRNT